MTIIGWVSGILSSPIFVSMVTALFTVFFTYWVRSRWNRVKALSGLLTEVYINRSIATANSDSLVDLIEVREKRVQPEVNFHEFQTSAYDSIKNAGILFSISPRNRSKLMIHYGNLQSINILIENRESLFGSIFPSTGWGSIDDERWDMYNSHLMSKERTIFSRLLPIVDTSDVLASHNGASSEQIRELIQNAEEVNYRFGDVEDILLEEIRGHRVLSRFVHQGRVSTIEPSDW